jgi:hypothetical protein
MDIEQYNVILEQLMKINSTLEQITATLANNKEPIPPLEEIHRRVKYLL